MAEGMEKDLKPQELSKIQLMGKGAGEIHDK